MWLFVSDTKHKIWPEKTKSVDSFTSVGNVKVLGALSFGDFFIPLGNVHRTNRASATTIKIYIFGENILGWVDLNSTDIYKKSIKVEK